MITDQFDRIKNLSNVIKFSKKFCDFKAHSMQGSNRQNSLKTTVVSPSHCHSVFPINRNNIGSPDDSSMALKNIENIVINI